MDAVQKANSGHPGTPMALAPLTHLLWSRFLKYNPKNPNWVDRDRFVLSCGHASMLLYSQLHLAGFEVSLEDLKQFRQWGSKTPGHPEYKHTAGVETTTGPLGQGFTNGVGMAIAEKHLAARFNRDGFSIVDHFTYVLASDGDLMEGVAAEAASIAGHLELGKLIVFYDDNEITIDGSTELAFSENVAARFEAYGWHVQFVADANDLKLLEQATLTAQQETEKPSLIIVRSQIGFGSPHKAGTSDAHGAPLGEEEIKLTKQIYGWDPEKKFIVPEEVTAFYAKCIAAGKQREGQWQEMFTRYAKTHPELAQEFQRVMEGRLPEEWKNDWPSFGPKDAMATRQASFKVMQKVAAAFPEFIGGSADLAVSNLTSLEDCPDFSPLHPNGRNIHFGIREHAMAGICNGIALHKGLLPFAATFFTFTDYMRPSMRLAALMNLPVRYVLTHDSIGLGEDGPTHQPIEHLMSLRIMPNMTTIRPADPTETLGAWQYAASHREGPMALVLTRQKVPSLEATNADAVEKGAYVLAESPGKALELVLIATGSEVGLAFDAWKELDTAGIATRLVSMPSWELFEKQPKEYRENVLPPHIKHRISIEAGATFGWQKYVGDEGRSIGLDHFGASAPANVLFEKFGLTKEVIVAVAKQLLS